MLIFTKESVNKEGRNRNSKYGNNYVISPTK